MVERKATEREARLSRVYAALADPTRRAILARLRGGDASISELAAPFDVSFAAISKHVGVLERAQLVEREVHGREHRLRLVPAPLGDAAAWALDVRALWERRIEALDASLRAHVPRKPARRRSGR